jgi:Flp pilus assembly protein TadD
LLELEALTLLSTIVVNNPTDTDAHFNPGCFLDRIGRPDDAVPAHRQAIALKPDHAESHCNLGIALCRQAEFAPALVSLDRGRELGSRRKDWRYPSAQWVQECRRQLELDGRVR